MQLTPWHRPIDARMRVPGDKSITHRAILFSALGGAESEVRDWLVAADTEASLRVAEAWGVQVVERSTRRLVLKGPGGREAWHEPDQPIDCANAGTTMRLAMGLAAGAPTGLLTVLFGDASLSRRPMARVADPLTQLGAELWTRRGGLAPVAVRGRHLTGGTVALAVASAQVKSALLLAGLNAKGRVTVEEPIPTRDHTERMLTAMGARLTSEMAGRVRRITIEPHPEALRTVDVQVPGDPSSAAFWATLAALWPGGKVVLEGVSLNPERLGFYHLLASMGAKVGYHERGSDPEPWGDITVQGGALTAVSVEADQVPAMIDELPLVALLSTQAEGESVVRGAAELRVKESDRIRATVQGLSRMGAAILETGDGFRIHGPRPLSGAVVDAQRDHRIAMMLAIASTVAQGATELLGEGSVAISYPEFFDTFSRVRQEAE